MEEADTPSASASEISLGKSWWNETVQGCSFVLIAVWDQLAARHRPRGARRAFASEANTPCNILGHSRYTGT